ncbi:hypothetical protein D9756_001535 [Leucocoprinus leucothites]|uniref:Uncharacterized protein n=1 Tax=Leucocoprinus leucothites TaxID=201217 RepID=A0A8H5LI45_9AGAR|nr:hypothetical protein D9756_001535 [Leucoagaricus leucothites]
MFSRCLPRTVLTQITRRQSYHSEALDKWINNPPSITLTDSFHYEPLSDLYITLPTRDGTRKPYAEPKVGQPVPYGSQLAFFHARKPEHLLRADGTDEDISPPAPFLRRMWAGGKMTWNNDNPMLVGSKVHGRSTVGDVKLKGAEKGKPMVFVTQKIEYEIDGTRKGPSLVEERAHVYFEVKNEEEKKKPGPKSVQVPSSVDFSFTYLPSVVTLFRFSALMFNAHHIHLDKEYSQKKEGYEERLVHGPLTALMLLETAAFNKPDIRIKTFEYRATNPLVAGRQTSINGVWTDRDRAQLWCVDEKGVVGMTGSITTE